MKTARRLIGLCLALLLCAGVLSAGALAAGKSGWQQEYEDVDDGSGITTRRDFWAYYKNGSRCTGWLKLGGKWYCFDGEGRMLTGYSFVVRGTDGSDAVELDAYYFGNDGAMRTGLVEGVRTPWGLVQATRGYFNADGRGWTGWWKMRDGWHYFQDGLECREWASIDGTGYCFDENGVMLTGAGWHKRSYAPSSGGVVDQWYYLKENGQGVNGWKKIDGQWYYFQQGLMVVGVYYMEDGTTYGFREDGTMITGWYHNDVVDEWYYFGADGRGRNGWVKDGGKWYCFDGGYMMADGIFEVKGTRYCFDGDGAMVTGWHKDGSGDWYYFTESGPAANGWKEIDGIWYYFQDGVMANGGIYLIKDKYYAFKAGGAMITGWYWSDMYGRWYYFDESGAAHDGWLELDGNRYYIQDGAMLTGANYVGETLYDFGDNGVCRGEVK